MFSLDAAKLLHALLHKEGVGFPARVSRVITECDEKLLANIADMEARDARQRAAQQLKVVGDGKAPEA